jgi:streptogramin lyase
VGGIFLDYWNNHGGLAQQGYPISDEFQEKSALDGKTYTVQYFERAVFESHPENRPPYNVLLSQLGTFRYRARHLQPPAPTATPQQPASPVGSVVGDVRIPAGDIAGLAYGAGSLWVVSVHGSAVTRVDPQSNQRLATIKLDHLGLGIVATDQAVWVTTGDIADTSSLVRIDPSTNKIVSTLSVGQGDSLALDGNAMWVASEQEGNVMRVDLLSNTVVANIPVFDFTEIPGGADVTTGESIVASNGQVWVADPVGKAAVRIDPATNAIAERIPVGVEAGQLSMQGNSLWIGSFNDNKSVRLDLGTKKVVASFSMIFPTGVLATDSAVWIASVEPGTVTRVNPATNSLVGTLDLNENTDPQNFVIAQGALWVTDRGEGQVLKIIPSP